MVSKLDKEHMNIKQELDSSFELDNIKVSEELIQRTLLKIRESESILKENENNDIIDYGKETEKNIIRMKKFDSYIEKVDFKRLAKLLSVCAAAVFLVMIASYNGLFSMGQKLQNSAEPSMDGNGIMTEESILSSGVASEKEQSNERIDISYGVSQEKKEASMGDSMDITSADVQLESSVIADVKITYSYIRSILSEEYEQIEVYNNVELKQDNLDSKPTEKNNQDYTITSWSETESNQIIKDKERIKKILDLILYYSVDEIEMNKNDVANNNTAENKLDTNTIENGYSIHLLKSDGVEFKLSLGQYVILSDGEGNLLSEYKISDDKVFLDKLHDLLENDIGNE